MKEEWYLIVLWERARSEEVRILADIRQHVEIVATFELAWPGKANDCFARFYGAKAKLAAGKERHCGSGPFRVVVVKDAKPRYGWRQTSRGSEWVNVRIFAMKSRYRRWTGGGHKVHTTNTECETRRDIFLLTGRALADWKLDSATGVLRVLPGFCGWSSLRELFCALEETAHYAVIRNYECLPDKFNPTLHGDIDLLVENCDDVAGILGGRRLKKDSWRVAYAVKVAGHSIHFDFRFVGDGYYDACWERKILKDSVLTAEGVRVPAPSDAFFALAYHALLQKCEMAADYPAKLSRLAASAGLENGAVDDAFVQLETFLRKHSYAISRPMDNTVYLDANLAHWRDLAAKCMERFPLSVLKPIHLRYRHPTSIYNALTFEALVNDGNPCSIDYIHQSRGLAKNEWKCSHLFASVDPFHSVQILFYHEGITHGGDAIIIRKGSANRPLRDVLDEGLDVEHASRVLEDILAIGLSLREAHLCHRNISLETLRMCPDGHIVLCDFRFAITTGASSTELIGLSKCFSEMSVFGGSRVSPGVWNDAEALVGCVMALGDLPSRDAIIRKLRAISPDLTYRVRLSSRWFGFALLKLIQLLFCDLMRRTSGRSPKRDITIRYLLYVLCGFFVRRVRKSTQVLKVNAGYLHRKV